ncbi:LicD family-domain-containing protein [Polychytrium aggregatum]|uniref:LicD family-domain-containing protein n=1 Tax=Polychytrium aggregatum TaxID=110093 RepID=UPI0022FEC536|nr:LicD family-domain-containing protein [Polychytrium aggregatum]KAI9207912.1 LicD family-domain-containing protein [Polychytrium aggregatum]
MDRLRPLAPIPTMRRSGRLPDATSLLGSSSPRFSRRRRRSLLWLLIAALLISLAVPWVLYVGLARSWFASSKGPTWRVGGHPRLHPELKGAYDVASTIVGETPQFYTHTNAKLPAAGAVLELTLQDFRPAPINRSLLLDTSYLLMPDAPSFFNERNAPVLDRSYLESGAAHPVEYPRKMYDVLYRDLFRAWAAFADQHRIPYWLSHGTLLGWYWNKRRLPWDTDIDVQISCRILPFLIPFNNTKLGDGRYHIVVSPLAWYRLPDTANTVDIRVIDTRSGVFLDIMALSMVVWSPGTLEDKSGHSINSALVQHIVRDEFEGIPAWVPRDHQQVLDYEYGVMASHRAVYRNYIFVSPTSHLRSPFIPNRNVEGEWVELDCTGLYETYILDSGWFLSRAMHVSWEKNDTACEVNVTESDLTPRIDYGDRGNYFNLPQSFVLRGFWIPGRMVY